MKMISRIWNLFLLVLMAQAIAACSDDNRFVDTPDDGTVSLAFSVSAGSGVTRMSSVVTQQTGFRDIENKYLYPFDTEITNNAHSLQRVKADELNRYSASSAYYNYIDEKVLEVPAGTKYFLCYCTVPKYSDDKFVNGVTNSSGILVGNEPKDNVTTSDISFSPEVVDATTRSYLSTTAKAVNNPEIFVYPAELSYFAKSAIKASFSRQVVNYGKTWAEVLQGYTLSAMQIGVQSVAIVNQLTYAVGCLRLGLVVSGNSLADITATPVALTETMFPLNAVFATGQYVQNYDFTPKGDYQYIVYDKEVVNDGITMGKSKSVIPAQFTSTLVLQSKDGENVRFALEFTNNSGQPFTSNHGTVESGAKFYLVGTIRVNESTYDYTKRIFTKAYTTKGTVTIGSLKEAYPYLPDLLDPRLETDIVLVPDWIQSTTTNVPL